MTGFNPGLTPIANPGYPSGGMPAFDGGGSAVSGIISSIQQVEFTIASAATTGTATITSVDTSRSVVFFSNGVFGGLRQTDTANTPDVTMARIELTNATTVTATRNTADTFAITVICTVVEYTADAIDSVQQGTVQITGANLTNTATITSVNTSRSVVLYNGATSDNTASARQAVAWQELSLTNATTVTGTRGNAGSAPQTSDANFVVIEFASGVIDSAQEFSITITDGVSTVNTATISSVDTSRSMIFPGGITNSAVSLSPSPGVLRATLTNATTVTATRNTATGDDPVVAGTVVEFAAIRIASIQRGTVTIGSGNTTVDETVTSVTESRSVLNCLSASFSSVLSMDPEEEYFTCEILNSTTLRFTRGLGSTRLWTASYELVEYTA